MISSPPILDEETASRLRVAIARLSRRLRPTAAAAAAGLTPTGSSVLLTVVRKGQVRLGELAGAESLNPTMLSRVIADLGAAGLVTRVSDAERIRRERTAALNAALEGLDEDGRRLVERALPALEDLAEQLKERGA